MNEEKTKKYLDYNTVLGVGIVSLIIKIFVGGIIGDAAWFLGDLLGLISFVMIIIRTFQKNVTLKSKLIGWGLVVVWLILMATANSMTKGA